MRRYFIFVPSIALGVIGAVWLFFRPFPYELKTSLLGLILAAVALVALLLGAAWILGKTLASFRYASSLLEQALSRFQITLPFAFALAALSSISEELFFRGAFMPLLGVWGQALVFGLLHPMPRRALIYTAFTFVAGVCFGYATLLTGSLYPAIAAHFVINLQGFLELRNKQLQKINQR
jgi:membrane protease YdiL (CAAX protease family)